MSNNAKSLDKVVISAEKSEQKISDNNNSKQPPIPAEESDQALESPNKVSEVVVNDPGEAGAPVDMPLIHDLFQQVVATAEAEKPTTAAVQESTIDSSFKTRIPVKVDPYDLGIKKERSDDEFDQSDSDEESRASTPSSTSSSTSTSTSTSKTSSSDSSEAPYKVAERERQLLAAQRAQAEKPEEDSGASSVNIHEGGKTTRQDRGMESGPASRPPASDKDEPSAKRRKN